MSSRDRITYNLSCTTLNNLQEKYREVHSVLPTTLIVSVDIVRTAYECLKDEMFRHLIIVTVPGLPKYSWILCGDKDMYYSDPD